MMVFASYDFALNRNSDFVLQKIAVNDQVVVPRVAHNGVHRLAAVVAVADNTLNF